MPLVVLLMKKAKSGDQYAVVELVNLFKNLILKNSFVPNQSREERDEFIQYLTVCLLEAINDFDFNYSPKHKKIF
jgi:hypothetical protein